MATWEEYKKTMVTEPMIFEEARSGNCEALMQYLDLGGGIEIRNFKGHTLLMLAAYNNQHEAAELLIDHGADVNSTDDMGNSVLMGVCFKGHANMAELLLSSGARMEEKNPHGMTALDLARVFGRKDVVSLLSDRPASWTDPMEVACRLIARKPSRPTPEA
ncbi:ankyrin repeat domain-containing protein [Bdellovibrio bacteriovorus]|uniref:Ankyrin domain-containing protein n=1 Tax=Bdellovibrio bacteriovorus str. Tiberius TaxID=1069642 RepID=K7YVW9_BDEBC|nr:ankyrin repeat domain-containing protein [Bdellovibrio bacteriovorus]AFY00840.1 ankyrin domain-containing protein [Bdellovibrio bacteriovorus str. Tiberius]